MVNLLIMAFYFGKKRISDLVLLQYLTTIKECSWQNANYFKIQKTLAYSNFTILEKGWILNCQEFGKLQRSQRWWMLKWTWIWNFLLNITIKALALRINPSQSERRKLVNIKAAAISEESHITHALSLKQQSVWLQWSETAFPFDFSWRNLIWGGISTHVFKFVLAASVNWVRTPDLMKLWGYKKSSSCCLCGAPNCTLHHILSNCSTALTQKRFTWRHDSVLSVIYQALNCHIQTTNLNQQASKPAFIQFVQAGHQIVKNNKPI